MADFLAAHPASDDTHLSDDLPDEEVLYAKVKLPWGSMVDPRPNYKAAPTDRADRAGLLWLNQMP